MSQSPLPPELEDLLASWRGRLPIGTELNGYVSRNPDVTVIRAAQPSFKTGEETSAAVRISREAIDLLGLMPAVTPALALLVDLAMRRAMLTPFESAKRRRWLR